MMRKPDVIATIGSTNSDLSFKLVEKLLKQNICDIRFNFSKYKTYDEISLRQEFVSLLQERYRTDLKIMLDLPYPGKKIRLHINSIKKLVMPTQKYFISSSHFAHDFDIYIDVQSIGTKVSKGQKMIYSDNKAYLKVVDILDDDLICVVPDREIELYNRKTISFNYIEKKDAVDKLFTDLISDLKPHRVALSFVENIEEINKFKETIKSTNIEIISKIETDTGIKKLNSILEHSNIMLARGDLALNADIFALYKIQRFAKQLADERNRALYVATGILTSLYKNILPTQSEIIDLSLLLKMEPKGIIFNSGVLEKNLTGVVDCIQKVFENLVTN